MKSLHAFHSPRFIAFDAATTCSRIVSGGPTRAWRSESLCGRRVLQVSGSSKLKAEYQLRYDSFCSHKKLTPNNNGNQSMTPNYHDTQIYAYLSW